MGGNDDADNLVDLTAEEHYVAHQLLVKIYPDNSKLVYAAVIMAASSHCNVRNNKVYGWIRRKVSESKKGHIPWNKNKTLPPLSDEHKRKLSEANKGKIESDETRRKKSLRMMGEKNPMFGKTVWKGKTHSDLTKRKMSELNKGEKNPNYGKTPSDETRKKISKAIKGKIRSDETRKRISESKKGQIPWNKGRTLPALSDEHKRKISKSLKVKISESALHG
jgi:hypothetical protein